MKPLLTRRLLGSAILIVLMAGLFFIPRNDEKILQMSGYTMGTTFHLQFVGIPSETSQSQLQEEIETLLQRLDQQIFSTYAVDSELSRFNRAAVGSRFSASPEFLTVVAMAQEISRLSDGAFDITVGPLVNLWGFGPQFKEPVVPPADEISAAQARVGFQHLEYNVEESWLSKDLDVYVDLSAIAKGYAVDVIAEYLDSVGVDGYFLEIGGELKIKGFKPGGRNWVPAIERPVDSAPEVYEILTSNGEILAIAGSGDYRNYFEVDGVRYSHEIDPRTGKPINHDLAAAYVIDQSTARADALATTFMVLGFERAMSLAQEMEQAAFFIVRSADGEFTSFHTDQFTSYIGREG